MTVVAALIAAGLAGGTMGAAPTATAVDNVNTEQLGDFETTDGWDAWSFHDGPEFPGATGELVRTDEDAHTGTYSARLTGDLTGGGNYVAALRTLNLDIQDLGFWVRTDDASFLTLRLRDSTGQWHQQRVNLQTDGAWQEVTVPQFDSGPGYSHWSGANDGVWHGPAQDMRVHLPKASLGGDLTGDVYIDDVTATVPPPELEIIQSEPGNIFEGEQPRIGFNTRGDEVAWTVTDFWGAQVATGTTPTGADPVEITLPLDAEGWYEFGATAYLDGEQIATRETTLARLSSYDFSQVEGSPFAMQGHFLTGGWADPTGEGVQLIEKAGAKSVREGSWWPWAEAVQGQYDFSRADDYLTSLAANDMQWLGVAGLWNQHYDHRATPYTPEAHQGLADFAAAMADTGEPAWIQIHNEPNTKPFGDRPGIDGFDGDCDATPECYFGMLTRSFDAVKAVDPNMPVITAGIVGAGRNPTALAWLDDLFSLGALDYMDGLAIHTYSSPDEPESNIDSLAALEDLIRQHNDGEMIPIWVTENGYPTHASSTGVSEATQAAYLPQSHAVAFNAHVERYFYYEFMNDIPNPDPTYHNDNYGLVRNTNSPEGRWTPKPAYVSYAAMTRALTGAEFSHRDDGIGEGVSSYVFDRGDGTQTHLMWADEATTLAVETDEPVTLTNIMGESETLTPQADRVYITVGEYPVYLTGTDLAATVSKLATLSVAPGVTDEAINATLTIDNTGTPRRPLWGTFQLAGTTTNVHVAPGRTVDIPITVPAQPHTGDRELVGRLTSRPWHGSTIARLTGSTTIVDPLDLSATHVLAVDGSDALRITMTNHASQPIETGGITWSAGDADGTAVLDEPIPSGETRTVDVPLTNLGTGTHDYTVDVDTTEHGTFAASGSVKLIDPGEFTPASQQTITVDGALDDLNGAHTIDLATDGTVDMRNGPYNGENDLSGTIALTWDEDNLYLSAEVTDDTHVQGSANSGGIWAGDSIQMAVQAGTPGESESWYEYGLALRADDVLVHNWLSPDGSVGPVADVDAAVTRSGTTTTYEIALPWSTHLAPIDPDHGVLSYSMLVNDNDDGTRKGWIEWGSGLGRGKNPNLFNPIRLEPGS
jgi:hypothetical protein